ncbi:conjugal transfer protein TraC [Acetobacter estunensis NRIC 0472]|uniref:Conjugal transfer protein TraC n=1 Tax=Acetobacter estunensis TaxID=104097 RepID=A0A967EJF8_9PROT|nr:conjugal transfer protein TraD [Acetobacter estunensis]NHO54999.1 conjugal transfer protein TraC [Acetobacter estunensis]GBQ29491.1 conjugal transfer protein TraC [Acetobacter estunensis NRIC 0472]
MSDAVLACVIKYATDQKNKGSTMRKPRDIDAELEELQKRARALKAKRIVQFGELVEATGADTLSIEALAGVLLAAVEQADSKSEAVARWTERGAAFFQAGGKKGSRKGNGHDQNGASGA